MGATPKMPLKAEAPPSRIKFQFRTASLLWLTAFVACLMAFGLFSPWWLAKIAAVFTGYIAALVALGAAVALKGAGRAFCLGFLLGFAPIVFSAEVPIRGFFGLRTSAYGFDSVLALLSILILGVVFGSISMASYHFFGQGDLNAKEDLPTRKMPESPSEHPKEQS